MPRSKVHQIRRGMVVASITCRRTRRGIRHSVAVSRLLRDGDIWKSSNRFTPGDLPLVRLVLDEAMTWILHQGDRSGFIVAT